jgi:hypothetical protein
MPRSRPATGAKASPRTAETATAPMSASSGSQPSPMRSPPGGAARTVYEVAPASTKNAWARESWPACPLSRVSPMAPTAPTIMNCPAFSQGAVR